MRSLADRMRVERVLRIVGLAALAAWILLALRPQAGRVERVEARSALSRALERWTRTDPISAAVVRFDTVPDAAHTAWLAALRHAGVPIHWAGAPDPLAIETFASAQPVGGHVLLVSGAGEGQVVSDALGPIDTVRHAGVRIGAVEGDLQVRSGRQVARVVPGPTREARRIYVAGSADWESKFVMTALEESGWRVSARLNVGPGQDVVQDARGALDTARYAAVVLLDSAAAARTAGVERFVRSGGGLILAGDATRAASVAPLTAWRSLAREVAPLGSSVEDTAWRGVSRIPLSVAGGRALVLQQAGGHAVLAARRHFAGRVVAVAYDQSWRWRMTGGERAVVAHRDWWSRLVGSVAWREPAASAGAAPLVSLYEALGDPSQPAGMYRWTGWIALARLLGVIATVALVSEWLLRRARGAA